MKPIALIKLLLLLLVLSPCTDIIAQTYTQTIRGKVVDIDSKSTIIGASIILLNSDTLKGTTTDIDGNFRLEKIQVGRRALKVSYVGYEDVILNNIIVTSGKEVILNIELREKVYTFKEVEIVAETDKTKANNDLVSISSRNFQAEEANRYAGSRSDPSRMVANYAGVATGSDARNDIIVRGNSPFGVLWRLEGVDIPNPNHFSSQGATGGPVSMLNNNVLGKSDFLTGAFPAEYGNKTAAVFDLKLRNGNNEKREYTGQVGVNGIELGAEGPISKTKGSSYLINYRYSTLAVFNYLGIRFGVSATPEYQDLSFKVNVPTKKAGVFTVWGIGGMDKTSLLDKVRKSGDWTIVAPGQNLIYSSSMYASGVSHVYAFTPKISGKTSFAATQFNYSADVDSIHPVSPTDNSNYLLHRNITKETNIVGNYVLTYKVNARHLFKTGVTYKDIAYEGNSFFFSHTYNMNIYTQKVKNDHTGLLQSFIHWQWRPREMLTLNTGVYYQKLLLNNSEALEPRFGARWQLFKRQSINFGYGLHSMMQPTVYYFYSTYNPATDSYNSSNKNLNFTKAQHLILGYDFNFAKNYRFKVEAYYQHVFNAPVQQYSSNFSLTNEGTRLQGVRLVDSLINKGTGNNQGVELTLEKFFSNHFYYLLTTSIFDSKYKGSNNVTHNTSFNGGYVFNSLAGYELPLGKNKNQSLALDLKYTHSGGNRYTPVDIDKSILANREVEIVSESYSLKYKDYSRFDVKLQYKINLKRTSHIIMAVVENVLNTKNILTQQYNAQTQRLETVYQLGLFYYGGYRIEF